MAFLILFHISNLLAFLAFLLRDQLHLRIAMAISFAGQALYYAWVPGGPHFDPLFWKIVSLAANAYMIVFVFGDRLSHSIPADTRALQERLDSLQPGEFRRLIAASGRLRDSGEPLMQQGVQGTHLHYLLKGEAIAEKAGRSFTLAAGAFIGEISFLTGIPATATVRLVAEAECISWTTDELRRLMASDRAIGAAMRGAFNLELAQKVAAAALPIESFAVAAQSIPLH